jgi:Bifunctional DNA primase/polymerase, N-terminal
MSALAMDTPGPFGLFASVYWEAGWHGVFPLPPERKSPPLDGWTGANAPYASQADVYTWLDDCPISVLVEIPGSRARQRVTYTAALGNIGIRLPANVIGIDVDNYGEKQGKQSLAELESLYGPLPETWRVTSRDDGVSGIRLFRVREGLQWPGVAGPGIEIIQARHRYVVVAPSIHPDTHRPYRWLLGDLDTIGDVPNVDVLPPLPPAWVAGLTKDRLARDITRVTLDRAEAVGWLSQGSPHDMCAATTRVLGRAQAELGTPGGSRHDAALMGTQALAHLQVEGHTGVMAALDVLRRAFESATGTAARAGEWDRLVSGAVAVAAARTDRATIDPCSITFAKLTGKIQSDAQVTQLPYVAPIQEHSSWYPQKADHILDNVEPDEVPLVMARTDGAFLFYPKRVNGIIGESEQGKSWIGYACAAQILASGNNVLIIDFEDVLRLAVKRLQTLGVSDENLRNRFGYMSPHESLVEADLELAIRDIRPSLILIDGLSAMMGMQGIDINSNADVINFYTKILQPLAQYSGAAVVYVDHIPKGDGNNGVASKGGIGAQSKRGLTDGCALKVHEVYKPAIGRIGVVRLSVDKDRLGLVEELVTDGKQRTAGYAVFDARSVPGRTSIVIEPRMPDDDGLPANEFRPTGIMRAITVWMADNVNDAPFTKRTLIKGKFGKSETMVTKALEVLVREGYVKCEEGARGSLMHTLVRVYSEAVDTKMQRTEHDPRTAKWDDDDDDED